MIRAATGSTLFFALAPGTVAGVIPFLATQYEANPVPTAIQVNWRVKKYVSSPNSLCAMTTLAL